ncbi:MAG: hypothetical protein Q4G62_00070 [Pseudomonadota bacterium]|nr:hypothetical protein [Pseudomonadota bacterium]
MNRRWKFLALLCACLPFAAPALTAPPRPAQAVSLQIVDRDEGRELSIHRYRAQNWVAGQPGNRYALRLRNNTAQRVMVVLSVDGVNVVTGETAAPGQNGYVLAPYQSAEINGWRKSLDDVAQFVFTASDASYAARTGRPDDIGVIGMAVFNERRMEPAPPIASAPHAGTAARAPARRRSTEAAADMQQIGTGHGEREYAPVSTTHFVRASTTPIQLSQIRYDSRQRLVRLGIIRGDHPRPPNTPRPFPGGFVADPPAW